MRRGCRTRPDRARLSRFGWRRSAPSNQRIEHIAAVDIDDSGVASCAPADLVLPVALQIHGERKTVLDICGAIHQRLILVEAFQLGVGELRRAAAHAQLIEPRTLCARERERCAG